MESFTPSMSINSTPDGQAVTMMELTSPETFTMMELTSPETFTSLESLRTVQFFDNEQSVTDTGPTGITPSQMEIEMQLKMAKFLQQAFLSANIMFWWNIIISPLGIVGNLLCILVMTQKHNRSISCSIYMGALAVADSLMLLANIGQIVLLFPMKFAPHAIFEPSCKAVQYVMFASASSGVLLIVALLVERVIAVTRPLHAATLLSPRRAAIISTGIWAFCLAYNIPRILVISASLSNVSTNTGAHCINRDSRLALGYSMTSFFATGVFPLLTIFILNCIIVCGVKKAKKKLVRHTRYKPSTTISSQITNLSDVSRSEASGTKGAPATKPGASKVHQPSQERLERQLTLMAIVMTTVFLICTVPRYAHTLIFTIIEPDSSLDRYGIYLWSAMTTSNLYALNSAVNFGLYVLTGSKFRADLVKLFHRR